jgi:surface protein
MEGMLSGATAFDQNLSRWCVENILTEPTDFAENSALTDESKPNWGFCHKHGFYLAYNGVTILSPLEDVGATGSVVINDVQLSFTKRSKEMITAGNARLTVTSGLTDLADLFKDETGFNSDISHWDVSSVTTMQNMFLNAGEFNQNLKHWDVSKVVNLSGFLNNSGMGRAYYDSLLIGWADKLPEKPETVNEGEFVLDAQSVTYSSYSSEARQQILDKGWTINDAGPNGVAPVISGLPETILVDKEASITLEMFNYVTDEIVPGEVEDVKNLVFKFETKPSLTDALSYNITTGVLSLTGPKEITTFKLYITVTDQQGWSGRDSVNVQVGTQDPILTAPIAESRTPGENATGVVVNAPVSVTFDQDVSEAVVSGVAITDAADNAVQGVSATLGETDNVLTITHDAFTGGIEYTVTIPAGTVENSEEVGNSEIKWTFTTLNNFLMADNEVTITCSDAEVGEAGVIDGATYTKRDKAGIEVLLNEDENNPKLATTCTSGITDMSIMFSYENNFNADISHWDVSNVTNMRAMFFKASNFNGNISDWDVSSVKDMSQMFNGAESFNQDIGDWDVSNVTNMRSMFNSAEAFNQNISTKEVTPEDASTYTAWDVGSVTDMGSMFAGASIFNQDISDWDVSSVTNMDRMFENATNFDLDTDPFASKQVAIAGASADAINNSWDWDLSGVTSLEGMFQGAESFNTDISNWDVSNIENMAGMFDGAKSFDKNLGTWDVSNVKTFDKKVAAGDTVWLGEFETIENDDGDLVEVEKFRLATQDTLVGGFLSGSGLSTTNADNIFVEWSKKTLQNGASINIGSIELSETGANAMKTMRQNNNLEVTWGGQQGVDDEPVFSGLPGSVTIETGKTRTYSLWNYVADPNTPDSELEFRITRSPSNIGSHKFDAATGLLTITAPAEAGSFRVDVYATNEENIAGSASMTIQAEQSTPTPPPAPNLPAPRVESTTPEDGGTLVAVDSVIALTFDINVREVSGDEAPGISATITYGTAGAELSGVEATLSGNTVTIEHPDFAEGVQYTVTIPAGMVENNEGDDNSEFSWSFTTRTNIPQVTLGSPQSGAMDIALKPVFSWNALTGANSYELQYGSNSDFSEATLIDSISGTTYTLESRLAEEQTYYWRVRGMSPNDPDGGTWSEAFSFTTGKFGPMAQSLSPEDGAAGVALNASVSITFDQDVSQVDLSEVGISGADENAVTGLEASLTDNVLSLSHDDFAEGIVYTVSIPAGAVQNTNEMPNEEITWSFTALINLPVVTLNSPEDQAGDVSLQPEFSWSAASGANSYELQYGAESDFSEATLIGEITGTSLKLASKLTAETTYYWRVRAISSNDPDGGDWSEAFSFTTGQFGPVVTTFTPEDGAAGVAVDAVVSVEYETDPVAKDLSGITLTDTEDEPASNVSASLEDNILSISHDDLAGDMEYTVTIPAGALEGEQGEVNEAISWSFTTGKPKFYLAENGITISCSVASIDETGVVDGVTYTKRTTDQITPENAGTTCTSGITDLSEIFTDESDFDEDISHWDVSSVTNMGNLFLNASSFDQNLSAWNVSNVSCFDLGASENCGVEKTQSEPQSSAKAVGKKQNESEPDPINGFLVGSGLSTENADAMFIAWSEIDMKDGVSISIGSIELSEEGANAMKRVREQNNIVVTYGGQKDVDDEPVFSGLPNSVELKTGETISFDIWDYVEDPNTADEDLGFRFGTNPNGVGSLTFNDQTGVLTLTAPAEADTFRVDVYAMNTENISGSGSFVVEAKVAVSIEEPGQIPAVISLMQNYPNPFNPSTVISFELSEPTEVRLEIFDMIGRKIATLINNEARRPGRYTVQFDASNLTSGTYMYRLSAGQFVKTRKMMLIK